MNDSADIPLMRGHADQAALILGQELRELRKARRMTLSELAQASGVSISHLSAIERGAVNPTLSKISAIASALAVPADWFLAARPGKGPMERSYVVRRGNHRNLNLLYQETAEQAGYQDVLLSSSIGSAFHMGLSEYAPYSEELRIDLYARDGEQHGYVLEGELVLRLEEEDITVRAGDSFSFPGHILHSAHNRSDKPARLIWVNSPVIIPKHAVQESAGARMQTKKEKRPNRSGRS